MSLKFLKISKKYCLNKKEIKIRFFRCLNYYFNDLLHLQKDIVDKRNKVLILDNEISTKRKVIEESQPIIFSILQYLINKGLNEHDILMAFKIFKTDLCNNMHYGERTYLECLSKDLNKYPMVWDTLEGLNNKILIKKSYIYKLVVHRTNLESLLLSLFITTLYLYFTILLNAEQVQLQKNSKMLLILNFHYLSLLCIVIKEHKKYSRSKFIQNRTEEHQEQQKIERNLQKRQKQTE